MILPRLWLVLAAAATTPALAADLVLKRAVLGTGGVGYFEYAAEVEGGAPLQLRARLDQVDDILKSLIVIDPAGPASITLPGKAGAAEAFASLPFSEADLASLPALVGALKGAALSVEGPRKLSGNILSAVPATAKDKDGGVHAVTRVSLLAGVAVEQFVLEEAEGLRFEDARIGAQVDAALKALRAARDRSGRDISIALTPGSRRTVRLGYVAEAPVWKAAYRLSLPKGAGKARLQGWAVLENMTGTPWQDVALTLTSGSPVTFRQALYDPYYVARQTVAPPVSRLALPRADQGEIGDAQAQKEGEANFRQRRNAAAPARQMVAAGIAQGSLAADEVRPASPPEPVLGASAPAADSAENLSGASFALTAPVKVLAGESLSLPFVDVEIAADEAGWLQPGGGRNPWHAVRLANAGEVTLPAGSVTLYETTEAGPLFAGEAQLGILPPGQSRLVAFGADQKIAIGREAKSRGIITEIILAKALLTVRRMQRETTVYRLANMDSRARRIIIDHPRVPGTALAGAEAAITGNAWRLEREVAAGKTEIVEVSVDRPLEQSVQVGGLSRDALSEALGVAAGEKAALALQLGQIGIDPAMRERLQKLAEAADALEDAKRRLDKLGTDREAIVADQERLRENLKAAPAGSDLAKLETRKLLAQEAQLDTMDADSKAAQAAMEAARNLLEDLAGRAAAQELRFKNKATL